METSGQCLRPGVGVSAMRASGLRPPRPAMFGRVPRKTKVQPGETAGAVASLDREVSAYVADGTITKEEAAKFTPEQLEFLIRKRTQGRDDSPARVPAPAASSAAANGAARVANGSLERYVADGTITREEASLFTPEQLDFLIRKRSAPMGGDAVQPSTPAEVAADLTAAAKKTSSPGSSAVARYVADGTITQEEANKFTPEQLEFLIRKRTAPVITSVAPAASAVQPAQPVAAKAAAPASSSSSSSSSGVKKLDSSTVAALVANGTITKEEAAKFTPEQLEFLVRKRMPGMGSSSPAQAAKQAQPAAAAPAPKPSGGFDNSAVARYVADGTLTQEEASKFTPEQLEFLIRKRTSFMPSTSSKPAKAAAASKAAAAKPAEDGKLVMDTAAVARYVANGTLSQEEAAKFTPVQLEFLVRKRLSPGSVASPPRKMAADASSEVKVKQIKPAQAQAVQQSSATSDLTTDPADVDLGIGQSLAILGLASLFLVPKEMYEEGLESLQDFARKAQLRVEEESGQQQVVDRASAFQQAQQLMREVAPQAAPEVVAPVVTPPPPPPAAAPIAPPPPPPVVAATPAPPKPAPEPTFDKAEVEKRVEMLAERSAAMQQMLKQLQQSKAPAVKVDEKVVAATEKAAAAAAAAVEAAKVAVKEAPAPAPAPAAAVAAAPAAPAPAPKVEEKKPVEAAAPAKVEAPPAPAPKVEAKKAEAPAPVVAAKVEEKKVEKVAPTKAAAPAAVQQAVVPKVEEKKAEPQASADTPPPKDVVAAQQVGEGDGDSSDAAAADNIPKIGFGLATLALAALLFNPVGSFRLGGPATLPAGTGSQPRRGSRTQPVQPPPPPPQANNRYWVSLAGASLAGLTAGLVASPLLFPRGDVGLNEGPGEDKRPDIVPQPTPDKVQPSAAAAPPSGVMQQAPQVAAPVPASPQAAMKTDMAPPKVELTAAQRQKLQADLDKYVVLLSETRDGWWEDASVWRELGERQSVLGDRGRAIASYRSAWQLLSKAATGRGSDTMEVLQRLVGELVEAGEQQQAVDLLQEARSVAAQRGGKSGVDAAKVEQLLGSVQSA